MKKNVKLNLILGIPILLCYFFLLPKVSQKNLWVNMTTNEIIFTFITLSISVGIYLYLIFKGKDELYYPMMIFLIGALLWPIFLYFNKRILVFIALMITSLGAVTIMIKDRNIMTMFLTFHVIFTDNILWGFKYLN